MNLIPHNDPVHSLASSRLRKEAPEGCISNSQGSWLVEISESEGWQIQKIFAMRTTTMQVVRAGVFRISGSGVWVDLAPISLFSHDYSDLGDYVGRGSSHGHKAAMYDLSYII